MDDRTFVSIFLTGAFFVLVFFRVWEDWDVAGFRVFDDVAAWILDASTQVFSLISGSVAALALSDPGFCIENIASGIGICVATWFKPFFGAKNDGFLQLLHG